MTNSTTAFISASAMRVRKLMISGNGLEPLAGFEGSVLPIPPLVRCSTALDRADRPEPCPRPGRQRQQHNRDQGPDYSTRRFPSPVLHRRRIRSPSSSLNQIYHRPEFGVDYSLNREIPLPVGDEIVVDAIKPDGQDGDR
jgi:hypothetical protein